MTLKEAKRAYKKDGGGFKFTPSQLARADRQDAQVEKRRKALEKEQTRENNKRKREDKAEKDRAVKRKMLEEGRITIEDTWGKVNASQPRLNKFFAHHPAHIDPVPRLRDAIMKKSEGDAENNLSDGLEAEDDSRKETGTVELENGACTAQDACQPVPLSNRRPSSQDRASVDVRNSLEPPKSLCKQSSPLQELCPSQLNAKQMPEVNDSTNAEDDHNIEEDFTDGLDDTDFLAFVDEQNNNGYGDDSLATPLRGLDDKTSPTPISNIHTSSTAELNPHKPQHEESHEQVAFPTNGNSKEPLPTVVNESFSAFFNEIDESELIAFAEQVEASMVTVPQMCSSSENGGVTECSASGSKLSNAQPTPKMKSPLDSGKMGATFIPAITRNSALKSDEPLGHSFAIVDDTNMVSKPITTTITSHVPPMLPPAEVKPLLVKPKRRRQMPWDDIDGPGPSTQAAILELLEQAEAQMRK